MTATARRDLQRIAPRIVPAIVEFAFGDLAAAPRRVGKPLQREPEGLYGARRGPYRNLYSVDDDANRVEILRIDHRSDVYRSD
ncbi:MAG: type II toxin-antitoxin system RelE/ParE family toxin [Actinomycetota bacterium]|nr:type II toxin-antitoxin system RelE/ParE family toxin [Actinomycetota bacterium]